jgi:hypothetical protein
MQQKSTPADFCVAKWVDEKIFECERSPRRFAAVKDRRVKACSYQLRSPVTD